MYRNVTIRDACALQAAGGNWGNGLIAPDPGLLDECATLYIVRMKKCCLGQAAGGNWGNLVVALDPGLLGNEAAFRRGVEAVLVRTKAATPLPGMDAVTLPGERGSQHAGALHSWPCCRHDLSQVQQRIWQIHVQIDTRCWTATLL